MKTNLKTRISMLAGAALVALTVVTAGPAVTPAGAERNTLCSATGATMFPPSDLDFEFFVEGDTVQMRDPSGTVRTMRCGAEGAWTNLNFDRRLDGTVIRDHRGDTGRVRPGRR